MLGKGKYTVQPPLGKIPSSDDLARLRFGLTQPPAYTPSPLYAAEAMDMESKMRELEENVHVARIKSAV